MPYYAVQLSAVTAQSPSGISTFTSSNQSDVIYTVLDSGSTFTHLPDYIITAIYSYLGATSIGANPVAIPCNRTTAESVFSFSFGGPRGPKINVPISDFVVPRDPTFENFTFSDGTPACTLSIVPSTSYLAILGDSFLRSAYVVYDIDNQQIALAQSNLFSTADSIITEITRDGIPGISASMPALPWNMAALRALVKESPISNLSTAGGAAASTTIPADVSSALPVMQGSVTAVSPAGAMWTGAGIPIPSGRYGAPARTGTNAVPGSTGSGLPTGFPLRGRTPTQISPPIVSVAIGAAMEKGTGMLAVVSAVLGVCSLLMDC